MRPDKVAELKKLLADSIQYRQSMYLDAAWNRYEDYWKADYQDILNFDEEGDTDTLPVPILVSNAQNQKAAALGGGTRITFSGDRPEDVPAARVLNVKMNHIAKMVKLDRQVDYCYQDAMTLGTGFLLDGFGSQFGIHADTILEGYDPSRRGKDRKRIEFHDDIHDNLPYSLAPHPSDIYLPPGTVEIAGAFGFFHRYIRHADEISADEKLMKKHRGKVKPNAAVAEYGGQLKTYESLKDMVILYDWFDLRNNHVVTFAEGYGFALQDEVDERLVRLDKMILHALIFNRNRRHFWGTSDFNLTEPLAQELNDIRTMQMKHRRTEIVKALIDVDMLRDAYPNEDVDDILKKLETDEVMSFVKVSTGGKNVKDLIATFTPRPPYDFPLQAEQCKKEIEEFGVPGGLGPNQKGMMSGGRHTKYETAVTEAHADRNLQPRRKEVREIKLDVMANWCKLIYDFWAEPQLVQTYDAAGNPVTVEFRGADLEGDYRLEMNLESMRTKSQEEKVAEANMIMKTCMPFIQMGAQMGNPSQYVEPASLLRQFLTRLDTDWDIEALTTGGAPQAARPMPFDQYKQQFMQQAPGNAGGIAAFMRGQQSMPPGRGVGPQTARPGGQPQRRMKIG